MVSLIKQCFWSTARLASTGHGEIRMGKRVSLRCSTSIHTTDTWMPPKQKRDSKTAPPPVKLALFDPLPLECRECYASTTESSSSPQPPPDSPSSTSTPCSSLPPVNFRKRAEKLSLSHLYLCRKVEGGWNVASWQITHFLSLYLLSFCCIDFNFVSWFIRGRRDMVCF